MKQLPLLAALLAGLGLPAPALGQAHAAHAHDHHAHAPVHGRANPASAASEHHAHGAHSPRAAARDDHAQHQHHVPAPAAARPQPDPHAGHATHASPPGDALPREPIPVITDEDRAAAFAPLAHAHAHDAGIHSLVRFNRLEAWDADGGGQAWEGSAWIGGDIHRLWLRSEGEREHGQLASADLEVLYGRSVSAWWDLVGGVRHDFAPGNGQDWLALGVQGLAPYKFEVSATAYLGRDGRSAFVAEVEYELPLGPRLILQPMVELTVHGKDDVARRIGSGLSSAEAGLRLRYELNRRFAPYVGLVHERSFGRTAELARQHGGPAGETRWVAGVRWWF
jgi:copper resistance protein B